MVPRGRLELPHPCGHRLLGPARLPISPSGRRCALIPVSTACSFPASTLLIAVAAPVRTRRPPFMHGCKGIWSGRRESNPRKQLGRLRPEPFGHTRIETWSEWQDLNLRPHGPQPRALPDCATSRFETGAGYRPRTRDPLLTKEPLLPTELTRRGTSDDFSKPGVKIHKDSVSAGHGPDNPRNHVNSPPVSPHLLWGLASSKTLSKAKLLSSASTFSKASVK
jgi:hypothetical protein